MAMTRRRALALVGGGAVVAAGTGGAAFVATRRPDVALAPWDVAGGYAEPRMRALSYAILAPNPHNLQPWLAEIDGRDRVVIHRDPARRLPETDPYDRQLTIGMGCFLELMAIAATATGHAVETELWPDGDGAGRPLAACRFREASATPDPLFAHVLSRRSHKEAFEARVPDRAALAPLTVHARVVAPGETAEALRRIAGEAWITEANTPAAWQESIDLLRIGKAEIEANPDGIDAGGPAFEAMAALGIFTREAAADPDHPGTRSAVAGTTAAIEAAPAFTVQVSRGNSRREQIAAGRAWLRLNLAATGAGLALRPVSQALQEYPEMAGPYRAVHDLAAPGGGTVQMLGLLGYGRRTARTPRWPLEAKLMHG